VRGLLHYAHQSATGKASKKAAPRDASFELLNYRVTPREILQDEYLADRFIRFAEIALIRSILQLLQLVMLMPHGRTNPNPPTSSKNANLPSQKRNPETIAAIFPKRGQAGMTNIQVVSKHLAPIGGQRCFRRDIEASNREIAPWTPSHAARFWRQPRWAASWLRAQQPTHKPVSLFRCRSVPATAVQIPGRAISAATGRIPSLDPDGCEFLLVFDDGSFDEDDTFLISDWFKHVPTEVLAKNFGVPASSFEHLPGPEQRYIFPLRFRARSVPTRLPAPPLCRRLSAIAC
jgi:hypothetical protein